MDPFRSIYTGGRGLDPVFLQAVGPSAAIAVGLALRAAGAWLPSPRDAHQLATSIRVLVPGRIDEVVVVNDVNRFGLAFELGVRGLMNVQYAVKEDRLYVIEVNPRASRTIPFVSKAIGKPLAKLGGNYDKVANARINIDMARLLTLKTAWVIDTQGVQEAQVWISKIKAHVPNVALDVIDDAIQRESQPQPCTGGCYGYCHNQGRIPETQAG